MKFVDMAPTSNQPATTPGGKNAGEKSHSRVKGGKSAASWLPWFILILGLTVTWLTAWRLHAWALESDLAKFNGLVTQSREQLETRMEKYELGMQLLQSYFHSRSIRSELEWKYIVSEVMKVDWNFPGLIEVGYARYHGGLWTNSPVETVIQAPRSLSPPPKALDVNGIEIPRRSVPAIFHYHTGGAPPRDYGWELYPQDIIEQYPTQAQKRGGLFPSRRKEFLPLKPGETRVGVTFYLPVYDLKELHKWNGLPAGLSRAHDDIINGFIFFSINMGDFLQSLRGEEPQEVRYEIFSSPEPSKDQWLNPGGAMEPLALRQGKTYFSRLEKMSWYTSPWSLHFYTTPLFEQRSTRYRSAVAAVSGLVLSFGLFAIMHWQARVRAREHAAALELQVTNERLGLAAEERTRLSRDLHDGAIQSVFGLGLGLDYCLRQVEKNPPKAIQELCRSKDELNEVIADLRKMVLSLQSSEIWQSPPREAWEHLLSRLKEISPVPLRVDIAPGVLNSLPTEANIHLLNIAREAAMNAIRHSKASSILVELRNGGSSITLRVRDDGSGFDPALRSPGQGLANMSSRARELGGSFQCSTARNAGTEIKVEISSDRNDK